MFSFGHYSTISHQYNVVQYWQHELLNLSSNTHQEQKISLIKLPGAELFEIRHHASHKTFLDAPPMLFVILS